MFLRLAGLLVLVSSALAATGCAAPAGEDTARAEEALTSLPNGTFVIGTKPYSGSYVARLSLSPGAKFEMEYVRRTTTSEPWAFNPWFSVPVTHEDALVLRGTHRTYEGGRGSMVSFQVEEGEGGNFIFDLALAPGLVALTTIDDRTFELRASSAPPTPTDARVVRCDGHGITAVIRLDEAQRRRGTLAIERKPDADGTSPPETTVTVVYTGGTGVRDYRRFEGRDADGNGYDFALRASELERTSGPISPVGLGFSPSHVFGGYAYHHSLTCTIARR